MRNHCRIYVQVGALLVALCVLRGSALIAQQQLVSGGDKTPTLTPQAFARAIPDPAGVVSRRYQIDGERTIRILEQFVPAGLTEAYTSADQNGSPLGEPAHQFGRGRESVVMTPRGPEYLRLWGELFRANHLAWSPQHQLFFNPTTGSLYVKAHTNDFPVLERLLGIGADPQPFHPSRVTLRAHFVEGTFSAKVASPLGEFGLGPLPDQKSRPTTAPLRGSLSFLGEEERVRRAVIRKQPPPPERTTVLNAARYGALLESLRASDAVSVMTPPDSQGVAGAEMEIALTRGPISGDGVSFPLSTQARSLASVNNFEVGSVLAVVSHSIHDSEGTRIEMTLQVRIQEPGVNLGSSLQATEAFMRTAIREGEALAIRLGTRELENGNVRDLVVVLRPELR